MVLHTGSPCFTLFALPLVNTQHLIYGLRFFLTGCVLLRVCKIIYLRIFCYAHFFSKTTSAENKGLVYWTEIFKVEWIHS